MGRGIMKRTYPRHSRSGEEGPVWCTVALAMVAKIYFDTVVTILFDTV
jgi:hypothetical protein